MAKKNKPKSNNNKPSVHDGLKDLDIRVNEMGEIVRGFDVDDLNKFLDENVKDKKLEQESADDAHQKDD